MEKRGVVVYQASHVVGRKEEGEGGDISGLSHGGKNGRGGGGSISGLSHGGKKGRGEGGVVIYQASHMVGRKEEGVVSYTSGLSHERKRGW